MKKQKLKKNPLLLTYLILQSFCASFHSANDTIFFYPRSFKNDVALKVFSSGFVEKVATLPRGTFEKNFNSFRKEK